MNQSPSLPIPRSLAIGALSGAVAGTAVRALAPSLGQPSNLPLPPSMVTILAAILTGALLGAGFGLLVRWQRHGIGENLFWGMTYGVFWWVLGQLTLLPLLLGGAFAWDLSAAQFNFPGLVGFLVHGSITGLLFALFRLRNIEGTAPSLGALGRGALVGLVAARILGVLLDAQDHLVPMGAMMSGILENNERLAAWIIIYGIGAMAGLVYTALYPTPMEGAGVSAIRGAAYGFFWWGLGGLTLLPLLTGQAMGWSHEHVRTEFPTLSGFILFGSALALLYRWFEGLVRLLLAEDVHTHDLEGPGVQFIRALGRGAASGLVGGAVFTLVMLQIGFLPQVASLVDSASPRSGLLVHFAIAVLIGMSYGVLFRRQSFDLSSALGWGMAYGFLWWILGALTLMPVFLGSGPQWAASTAAETFPALVGHLGYGASLGVAFFLLEARDRPWWLSRSQSEAERIAQRQEQILTSAPAIWVLIVMIALMLPVLLGTGA